MYSLVSSTFNFFLNGFLYFTNLLCIKVDVMRLKRKQNRINRPKQIWRYYCPALLFSPDRFKSPHLYFSKLSHFKTTSERSQLYKWYQPFWLTYGFIFYLQTKQPPLLHLLILAKSRNAIHNLEKTVDLGGKTQTISQDALLSGTQLL